MSQRRVVVETFASYQDAYEAKQSLVEANPDTSFQIRRKSRGFDLVRREITKTSNKEVEVTGKSNRRRKNKRNTYEWEMYND